MNSSKRGAVYGFKLQSLDLVSSLWALARLWPMHRGVHLHTWAGPNASHKPAFCSQVCWGWRPMHVDPCAPPPSPLCLVHPQLLDTKSTDRKMTLLHFIALTVREKYPDLATFWQELHFVEKAAAGAAPLAPPHWPAPAPVRWSRDFPACPFPAGDREQPVLGRGWGIAGARGAPPLMHVPPAPHSVPGERAA